MPKPATILYLNHTGQASGAERVMLGLVEDLDRTRFEPVIASPDGTVKQGATKLGVKFLELPSISSRFSSNPVKLMCSILSSLSGVYGYRKIIREVRPSLIHANTIRSGLIASLAGIGLGIPMVWHLHDLLPGSIFAKLLRLMAYINPSISAIAVSHATAECFRLRRGERFVRRMSITVIHNSVDTERFRPDAEERTRIRQELNLSEGAIAVAVLGQITRRKQQLALIQAFAKQIAEVPNVHLFVIGAPLFTADDKTYSDEIDTFIAQNNLSDRVHRLGARGDVPALLNGMDIVALNSASEPFGLAILEALATEVPTAAPAREGFLEMIEHGVTGLLSSPDQPDALVRDIQKLADDASLRCRFGQEGRRQMIERFPHSRLINAHHALYEQIIFGKNSRSGS